MSFLCVCLLSCRRCCYCSEGGLKTRKKRKKLKKKTHVALRYGADSAVNTSPPNTKYDGALPPRCAGTSL